MVFRSFFCIMLMYLYSTSIHAANYSCMPLGGAVTADGSFGVVSITDPDVNKPGSLLNQVSSWDISAYATAQCDCPSGYRDNRYFSTEFFIPKGNVVGGVQYFTINEYLEASFQIFIAGGVKDYVYAPFIDLSNQVMDGGGCDDFMYDIGTGNKGYINLRFKKGFVGEVIVPSQLILKMFVNRAAGAPRNNPYMQLYLSGKFVVPPSCTINAGAELNVDLGTLFSSDFGAAGEKPSGYTPRTIEVPIQCNDASAMAHLTLNLSGDSAPGLPDALKTNNDDVGVKITDESGKVIIPDSTVLPFEIDDAYRATLFLQAYPVSTAGVAPRSGDFSATALLYVYYS